MPAYFENNIMLCIILINSFWGYEKKELHWSFMPDFSCLLPFERYFIMHL